MCLTLCACASLWAQNASGTGGVTGVVTDASGSAVPGAHVSVENESKGIRREMTTTGDGIFSAPSLVPAPGYKVTITQPGFATYEANNIRVEVGETVSLAPKLQVATATTQVEVVADAPVVEATKTDVSQVVGTRQIQDLPINGRRVDSFVLLTPGVTTDGSFGLLSFRGNTAGNTFLTDGIDTTNQ
ncbi:MAG: carboxypeptidase regulatory-like domain-containing protein, partial [Acidobacteriaceae bacterium]|nr:carboxypeptidase regulatory-like domain-containing protein [Acidobacteriaceae bacterium]